MGPRDGGEEDSGLGGVEGGDNGLGATVGGVLDWGLSGEKLLGYILAGDIRPLTVGVD